MDTSFWLNLALQLPLAAVVGVALYVVYRDARADRKAAADERAAMMAKLDDLNRSVTQLSNDINNWMVLRRRGKPTENGF